MTPGQEEAKVAEEKFEQWAILELMGHRRIAGYVTEQEIGGSSFLRVDVPFGEGQETTQFYSPSAVYCLTPTTAEIARAVAVRNQPQPVHAFELSTSTDAFAVDEPEDFEDKWDDDA